METQLIDRKLEMIIQHYSTGLAEIDGDGNIIHLNPKGKSLLKPIQIAHNISENNLFQVLERIAPALIEKITASPDEAGNIVSNETYSFSLPFGGEHIERHFSFTVSKIFSDCIIVDFDDVTSKRQNEETIQALLIDRAVSQGKFELASNILHDIGNALVGFGSYINRIKRSLEQSQVDNVRKLSDFFSSQQEALIIAFGEAKSEAMINILNNLLKAQTNSQEEIQKSINEQTRILTHVQEILKIQRQYTNGHEIQEKKPLNLRSIIDDCMSMLLASIEKRGIKVTIDVPEKMSTIMGDRTRMMQVILNILKNSVEAIDLAAAEKAISLTVITHSHSFDLQIQDNGQGFDKETGSKLFARGFTTKASGSGIGLHSCRAILENHEATIDISSEGFGKGSVTTIKFRI